MLNETKDGPVFDAAVDALRLVRLWMTRALVILSSGRWDGRLSVGSVSNPGSRGWDHVWGDEAIGAPGVATDHLQDYWMKTGRRTLLPAGTAEARKRTTICEPSARTANQCSFPSTASAA